DVWAKASICKQHFVIKRQQPFLLFRLHHRRIRLTPVTVSAAVTGFDQRPFMSRWIDSADESIPIVIWQSGPIRRRDCVILVDNIKEIMALRPVLWRWRRLVLVMGGACGMSLAGTVHCGRCALYRLFAGDFCVPC
ncbi:hypothetical protein AKJ16_DCAP06421, partial [Drosera capensis]